MYIVDDSDSYKDGKNAGSKARYDVAHALGGEILAVKTTGMNTLCSYLKFRWKLWRLKKTDDILLQYPLYLNHASFLPSIYKALSKKNATVLIHDLNSLREEKDCQEEIEVLSKFQKVISHNPKMTQFLRSHGLQCPTVDLHLFDYLGEGKVSTISYDVGLAGNLALSKSSYLYDLVNKNPEVTFQLFGVGLDESKLIGNHFKYEGSRSPEALLSEFQCAFGLVWDGDSITSCEGPMGRYERYNNPHKLSLYISCGIPVIVWKEAAIADFVLTHNIGIVVDDLTHLHQKLEAISAKDYQQMKKNLEPLTQKVKTGAYIQAAWRGDKQ